jgi:hypothetical protein
MASEFVALSRVTHPERLLPANDSLDCVWPGCTRRTIGQSLMYWNAPEGILVSGLSEVRASVL